MRTGFIIHSLGDIKKKDSPLSYRNEYWALVNFRSPMGEDEHKKIHFIVERSPLGDRHITVKMMEMIDYPCVELIRKLRLLILEMDEQRQLP